MFTKVSSPALLLLAVLLPACDAAPVADESQDSVTAEVKKPKKKPACRRTGCGGDVCADKDVITTCVLRPESICLEGLECERQQNDECGFTMTEEANECLAEIEAGEDVYLTRLPTQCGTNPWEMEPVSSDEFSHLPGELAAIAAFYQNQGFSLREIGLMEHAEPIAVCLACNCPRGDRLVVRASPIEAQMLKAQGFKVLDNALATTPVQCGGNPWELVSAPSEQAKVVKWAKKSLKAKVSEVGFLENVELTAVCAACSCPRGDLLVVLPATKSDAKKLKKVLSPL